MIPGDAWSAGKMCIMPRMVHFYLMNKRFNPSNTKATFCPMHKDAKIFEKNLNPVMLVFIE